jgi:hypothetical protein
MAVEAHRAAECLQGTRTPDTLSRFRPSGGQQLLVILDQAAMPAPQVISALTPRIYLIVMRCVGKRRARPRREEVGTPAAPLQVYELQNTGWCRGRNIRLMIPITSSGNRKLCRNTSGTDSLYPLTRSLNRLSGGFSTQPYLHGPRVS